MNLCSSSALIYSGSLLAIATRDPTLSEYGIIVIDEAHQHTVPTDILLGLLKSLSQSRKDLKIVIMSATIDAELFTKFFGTAEVVEVSGKPFDVAVSYLPEGKKPEMVDVILNAHLTGPSGNILVFMPGVGEMLDLIAEIKSALSGPKARFGPDEIGPLDCYPIYAALETAQQEEAVEAVAPAPRDHKIGRKVLVATNIAETSITFIGVTHVIDKCEAKCKVWNAESESWSLVTQLISKAVAWQRAGRAGRTREGHAIRYCSLRQFLEEMPEHSVSAMLLGDMLDEIVKVLRMKLNPLTFSWIAPPATETVIKALNILQTLDIVKGDGLQLTPRGELIAPLPLDVYSATTLIESPDYNCSDEILTIVSMLEASEGGSSIFIRAHTDEDKKTIQESKRYFSQSMGDHICLLHIYMAYRQACQDKMQVQFANKYLLSLRALKNADKIRDQLLKQIFTDEGKWKLRSLGPNNKEYYTQIKKALAAGNFLRVAKRVPGEDRMYDTVRTGDRASVPRTTDMGPKSKHNEWVIYNEFYLDSTKQQLRCVTPIAPEYLVQSQPGRWADAEFLPTGHIQDAMVKIIATMAGETQKSVRGGMPKKP